MLSTPSHTRTRHALAALFGVLLCSCLTAARAAADPPGVVGLISTAAGTGTAGVGGDGGPATAAQINSPTGVAVDSSGNVYIADQSNHRIRKIAAGTGVMSTFAGTGVAGFLGDGGPA